ncbi:crossover junction endodeoxyribonuclease RuvC [Lyticum sinuosum]|uniref:Crossover junction endodeoxyribonuclease RuvC n=1 Tax=Lyticum sinuosum TaxID=1332059 RepID=A0AAE4VLD8_9RICK|nr:crossover junction endodeoxyribonuclease RuvC [Lyticum sinuosum]MDZ5761362.1 Crossover junction endodeoxyribonuclease RuvC [Lyticum sinuosum]
MKNTTQDNIKNKIEERNDIKDNIILGIDPGLKHTGWALINKTNDGKVLYISSGVIKNLLNNLKSGDLSDPVLRHNTLYKSNSISSDTKNIKNIKSICDIKKLLSTNKKSENLYIALGNIFKKLNIIIQEYNPNCAAIENTYANINLESSLKLAQARAAAIIACSHNNLFLTTYQAKTIKQTVSGNGNADKEQIKSVLPFHINNFDQFKKKKMIYDETDAIAIAICHLLKL